MDIYDLTAEYVFNLPITQSWTEFREVFEQISAHRPKHWLLPMKSCQAVGGSVEQAIPAVAAIACAQIGIVLLDDMLDEDPRGEYHRLGHGVAANLGVTFQFAGLEAMFLSKIPLTKKIATLHSANQMLLAVAFGQDIDVKCPTNEAAYWQIVENKSAAFFGAALLLGSVLGGASEKIASRVKRFGQLYGEMIQIHDDLNDAMAVPAGPDWLQKRAPLPILFAQIVDHPERKRFLDLYENITNPEALKEAQEILIRCGAVSYCIDQLLHRHLAVQKILEITPLVNQQMLYDLSNEIVEPVWSIFDLLGMQLLTPFLSRME